VTDMNYILTEAVQQFAIFGVLIPLGVVAVLYLLIFRFFKKTNEYHWYIMTFYHPHSQTYFEAYKGLKNKEVRFWDITSAKMQNNLGNNCALINVSYLGKMSQEKFELNK
jgi:hypothetical protein